MIPRKFVGVFFFYLCLSFPLANMTEFDLINTFVEAQFRKVLSTKFGLNLDTATELRGNTLWIFLPDLDGLALWQNHYQKLIAAADDLGVANLRLQDSSLPFPTATCNIANVLSTQVRRDVERLTLLDSN